MSLKDRIQQEIKDAMKRKDQEALRALRSIKSAILLAETAEGRETGTPLTEAEEMQLLNKAAKQRRDSLEQYQANGRDDLAQGEAAELRIIEGFLPEPLSEAELDEALKAIIAETGSTTVKDLGRVMKPAQEKLAGRVDNKLLSEKAKALL